MLRCVVFVFVLCSVGLCCIVLCWVVLCCFMSCCVWGVVICGVVVFESCCVVRYCNVLWFADLRYVSL